LIQDQKGVRPIGLETFKNCWPRACDTSSRFSLEFGIWLPNTFWGGKLWVE
jgi:hypothetical protein